MGKGADYREIYFKDERLGYKALFELGVAISGNSDKSYVVSGDVRKKLDGAGVKYTFK